MYKSLVWLVLRAWKNLIISFTEVVNDYANNHD